MYPFLLRFFLCTQMNTEDIPQCLFVKMRQPSNSQIGKRKKKFLVFYLQSEIHCLDYLDMRYTNIQLCVYTLLCQKSAAKLQKSTIPTSCSFQRKQQNKHITKIQHIVLSFNSRITLNLKLYFTSEFAFLNKWMSGKLPSLWKTCRYKSYF